MAKTKKTKGLHLDLKNQDTRTLGTVAAAVFISIFCLTATKVLISNGSYKRQVISARHQAIDQVKQNISSAQSLINQFSVFEGDNPKNIIGGKNTTDTDAIPPDGNNSRIVLDALPSSYDFPALITSMAKILHDSQLTNPLIGGSDTSATDTAANPAPTQAQPVPIPLTVSGQGQYKNVQNLIRDLERSIRPFDITNLSLVGSASNFTFTATMNTYYQPPKTLTITTKEIH